MLYDQEENAIKLGELLQQLFAIAETPNPAVLEPERGDGKARGVTREWAALHPEGPPDFDG